ncbi:hypothetical protein D3C84_991410 [compost metagenome]
MAVEIGVLMIYPSPLPDAVRMVQQLLRQRGLARIHMREHANRYLLHANPLGLILPLSYHIGRLD